MEIKVVHISVAGEIKGKPCGQQVPVSLFEKNIFRIVDGYATSAADNVKETRIARVVHLALPMRVNLSPSVVYKAQVNLIDVLAKKLV